MTQKIMLITGTRKGIGRSLVEYYIENGYYVIGCSRDNADYTLQNYFHLIADVANYNGPLNSDQ